MERSMAPVRIRLSRLGAKGKAVFGVVVADSRAPRDGKFIEKVSFRPVFFLCFLCFLELCAWRACNNS